MRPSWIKVVVVLAVVWLVVWGGSELARRSRPTPEGIVSFVQANPLEGRPPSERTQLIDRVASQVNGLEYEQRRELNQQRKLEPFWNSLTTEERNHYLNQVLPTGFKQMMENFNRMEPGKRKRMVQKAVEELRSQDGERPPRDVDEAQMRKIVDQGLKAFYSDATIEAKMDALPFLEELERTVKWGR